MAHYLFRCDASPAIGVGHFMRSSVLAGALRETGHQIHFAMRETTPLVEETLVRAGFSWHRLVPAVRGPTGLMDELPGLCSLIERAQITCVAVDHYEANAGYFSRVRLTGVFLGAMDDLGKRDLRDVHWLLNQNLGADHLSYQVSPSCLSFLGPEYCLLRPQFAEARARLERTFTSADRKVLLTLGGGDALPDYVEILKGLNEVPRSLEIRLIWPGALEAGAAAALANLSRHNVEILHNVATMAEQMTWADLSINGGGSTCWELCSLGVPMLVLALSPDQEMVATALAGAGACRRVQGGQTPVGEAARNLLEHPRQREALSTRARALVDGLGAKRVARALEAAVSTRRKDP